MEKARPALPSGSRPNEPCKSPSPGVQGRPSGRGPRRQTGAASPPGRPQGASGLRHPRRTGAAGEAGARRGGLGPTIAGGEGRQQQEGGDGGSGRAG